jgi:hypothetical protein
MGVKRDVKKGLNQIAGLEPDRVVRGSAVEEEGLARLDGLSEGGGAEAEVQVGGMVAIYTMVGLSDKHVLRLVQQ